MLLNVNEPAVCCSVFIIIIIIINAYFLKLPSDLAYKMRQSAGSLVNLNKFLFLILFPLLLVVSVPLSY